MNARARLRALEDQVFGKDATRINGHIERGSGSAFAKLDDAMKAKFHALDRLIEVQDKVAAEAAQLGTAQNHHASAEADYATAKAHADAIASVQPKQEQEAP